MRYRVVALGASRGGRMKSAALRAACDDYLSRLRHYAKIEEREVTEARIPADSRLVALAEGGEGWTSTQLAELVGRWEMEGRGGRRRSSPSSWVAGRWKVGMSRS